MKQAKLLGFFVIFAITHATGQTLDQQLNHPLSRPFDSAGIAYKNRDFNKAIRLYTQVIEKTDSSSSFELHMRMNALIYRSFCKKELKDYAGSVGDMNRAIVIDPKDLASYIDRGTTYLEWGKIEEAKRDFLKIVQIDSKSNQAVGAYYYLALISQEQSNTPEAIQYLTNALKLEPEDLDILFTRAYYYGMTMESEKAIKDYDRIVELDPSVKEVYANRGTEKINLYNRGKQQDPKLLASACKDLKKAKQMGDDTVDDMIFIHCK